MRYKNHIRTNKEGYVCIYNKGKIIRINTECITEPLPYSEYYNIYIDSSLKNAISLWEKFIEYLEDKENYPLEVNIHLISSNTDYEQIESLIKAIYSKDISVSISITLNTLFHIVKEYKESVLKSINELVSSITIYIDNDTPTEKIQEGLESVKKEIEIDLLQNSKIGLFITNKYSVLYSIKVMKELGESYSYALSPKLGEYGKPKVYKSTLELIMKHIEEFKSYTIYLSSLFNFSSVDSNLLLWNIDSTLFNRNIVLKSHSIEITDYRDLTSVYKKLSYNGIK